MLKLDLKPAYLDQLKTLLKLHAPHVEVWAYGSRVGGDCHEASDLDLVARNPEELSRPCEKLYELKEILAQSNIPILVDLLDWARLPASFQAEIEKACVVIQRADTGE